MPDGDAARLSWRKIVAEGLSIVVSILLAFAIDAWWDSRKDLGEEREHLNALKLEFRQDREVVAREILVLEDAAAATKTLLALDATEASQIDADSLASLFDRSVRAGASAPIAAGAVQSLLSSGDLGLIRDKELASRIAAWPSQLADVAVNQQLLVRNREEALLPFVDQFMGELWIARRSRCRLWSCGTSSQVRGRSLRRADWAIGGP